MKNNKIIKTTMTSAVLLGLIAPTVLATTNVVATTQSKQDQNLESSINATTGNNTITIDTANGIPLNDQKFNAYRLMDAHYINDKEEGYVIIPAWQDFFDKEVKTHKGTHCSNQEAQLYLISMQNSPAQFKGFKERVYQYAKEKNIQPLGTADAQKDTYKISGLPDGYYIVIQEENDKTVSLSKDMLVTLDGHNSNATIKLKADVPSLLKTINGTVTDGKDKKAADFYIGEEVPFRLVSRVPDMSGFQKDDSQKGGRYVFEIQDKMSKGLTLNPNSIHITIGGREYKDFDLVNAGTTSDGSTLWKVVFGINNNGTNKDDCTIDKDGAKESSKNGNMKESLSDADGVFNDPMFNGDNKGKAIQVSYTATLNSNAILGGLGNPNTSNVLYSSNPYQPEKTNNTWDSTAHAFTYGLDLTKVDDTKKLLAGAEFELQTTDGKKIAVTGENGTYTVTNKKNDNAKLVSNDKGKIIVKGLEAGNYKLVETKAPAGYNLLEAPIEFTIKPTYSIDQNNGFEGKLTELTVDGKDKAQFTANKENGFVATTVINKAGGLLPKTGGRGIFMLAVIGLALMALATYVLFGRKKATK